MYAEVAVNAAVSGTFHYQIPPELDGKVLLGHLVHVDFGTAVQHAIVVGFSQNTPAEYAKPIKAILDPQPVVTEKQIDVALWMSRRYLAPPGLCLWLMLPPGLTNGRDIRVILLDAEAKSSDPVEQKVLDWLRKRGGSSTGRRLELAKPLQGQHWRAAVETLTKSGVVYVERILNPPRVRPRVIQTASLAIHPNQILAIAPQLGKESKRADLLETLAGLPLEEPPIERVLMAAGVASRSPLDTLAKAGLVTIDRAAKTVALAIERAEVPDKLIEMRGGERDLRVLKMLAREPGAIDVSWVYAQTGTNLDDLKRLEEEDLIALGEKETWRDSLSGRDFVPTSAPPLMPEQASVWTAIETRINQWGWGKAGKNDRGGLFLLHGVTGSGKTEIYLRAIERTLAQGRGAIFLVPEIALTAQTVRRVAARFPGQTAVVHSGLTEGERYDTWRRAREGLINVIVGARSALFTPLPDVGLVILDEEHDQSYKQSQSVTGPPYYHARDVAEQMMRANNGVLILGSATPDVETAYRAEQGEFVRLRLPTRILGHRVRIQEQSEREGIIPEYRPVSAPDALGIGLPPVEVVDMREELKAGNRNIFSQNLHRALAETLRRKEQAILFLNRRGASTYVFCRDCGYVASCPRCDTPLTFHRHDEMLRCHRCGHQVPQPVICPQCRSNRIKYFGAGTQQVEQALAEQFPTVRILRWDADTANSPGAHEIYLQRFIEHKADVLVGTQMIAKGLDLPLVTLVGVISADTGLNMPDFRAGEHTFQLLTQVAGRAGRGLLGGRVILQTYQPEHYAVQFAAQHDTDGFYAKEIAYRRDLGYPPFRRMARIVIQDANDVRARSEAENAARLLQGRINNLRMTGTEVIGPAPCFFSRINRIYRWHVLLRGPDPAAALRGLEPNRGWHIDIDPVDLL